MKKGLLIIISGPSGVGKGTIRQYFMNDDSLRLAYSISMTTRSPRQGEKDGVDYLFTTRENFEKAINDGELLEWAEFVGNYYGTPLSQVEKLREEGKNVLLEIEVQGAFNIKKQYEDALLIFITAPSAAAIKERLVGRGTESEEVINKRINRAKEESEDMDKYDYIVIDDQVEDCADRIHAIVQAKDCLLGNNLKFIEETKKELEQL